MKESKKSTVAELFVLALLCVGLLCNAAYQIGINKGRVMGAESASGQAYTVLEDENDTAHEDIEPAPDQFYAGVEKGLESMSGQFYTGPEAWMLNPTGAEPFWVERTDEEALALEVSDNATIEMMCEFPRKTLDASVPLGADESFQLVLAVDEEIEKDKLHEMNCYYPEYVPAGETFEVRIVLEEENGDIYVGAIQLTAGDEDLNLVHGDANPEVWYGYGFVGCDDNDSTFTTYFYTGATEAHRERPMFAGKSGYGGIVHCNYHPLMKEETI